MRLAIAGTGMVTPVGYQAASSCAAMRCGIDGFAKTAFVYDGERLRGAYVPTRDDSAGVPKLTWMATRAIDESLKSLSGSEGDTAIALCLPEDERPGRLAHLDARFFANVVSRLASAARIGANRLLITRGSLGGVEALQWADEILSAGEARYCVVAGVDTFLHGPTLGEYYARRRLVTKKNADGFLPGEAAAAVVLAASGGAPAAMEILGIGWGRERATQDSEHPLRGDGLTVAYRAALKAAGCGFEAIDYRIADIAGDQYAFKEASLALARTMRVRKEALYLWHAADCIGRVGAASVPVALGVAVAAVRRAYAPGPGVLCHFTEDAERRAAVVLRESAGAQLANDPPPVNVLLSSAAHASVRMRSGAPPRGPVNEVVLWRHASDARSLWMRRQRVLRTNRLVHAERVRLDMRLDGHLAALRTGGEVAFRVTLGELELTRRAGSFFAPAWLALQERRIARFEQVLEVANVGEAFDAFVAAIGWLPLTAVGARLGRLLSSIDPALRALAIAGLAAHRRPMLEPLRSALGGDDARVRAGAAKAAGELGHAELVPELGELLGEDEPVRFEAARALARFADARGRAALLAIAEGGGPRARRAVGPLVQSAPKEGVRLFRRWAATTATRPLAIEAARTLGLPELVDELIGWMHDHETARAAGETFRTISGLDLVLGGLALPRPAAVHGDPTDDPDDPLVDLDDEYELPFPSPLHVSHRWAEARARFVPGARYLDGILAEPNALHEIARAGRPLHRTMAARALAQATPTRPTLEPHAPATQAGVIPGAAHWPVDADGKSTRKAGGRAGHAL